jgi:hypothetical protein
MSKEEWKMGLSFLVFPLRISELKEKNPKCPFRKEEKCQIFSNTNQ